MKTRLVLFILLATAVLGAALGQPAPLPADERFDQPVEFKTDSDGESLSSMVAALARGIGLTPIVEQVPDVPVIYDIGDPKPFRQVWDIVLTLNDLDYRLLENDVIVVGPPGAISALGQAAPRAGADGKHRLQRFYRVNNNAVDLATIIGRAVPGIAVEPLESVNTLSVTATEEEHERVQATLDQFDAPIEVVPIELRTYRLSNADAVQLAAVLEAASGSIISEVGGESTGAAAAGEGRNFRVTAEPRTNSLIVAATAAVQARVAQLIPQLDVPQRQVNVQVRIQEINTRTAEELGINLAAGVGKFGANILDTGLRFIFDAQNALTSLNVGAVLDSLETQGLSRRVDDTTLTVLDNVTGTVQAGGTIFITIAGVEENIQRTIPYGVQVEVTPRIAADGRVTLDVLAKVEDVLSTTLDPSFLELSTRAVTSTVSLQPGQTVLLSGLMQNQLVTTRNRVPLLGAIPLIGGLFGNTVTEQNNTELLVIVSAVVLE
jgi:type II secretory pathway component GspD/PulD (secretin)